MRDDEANSGERTAGTPILDLEHYRAEIAGQFDNEEAADAFLHSLWFIMCTFVEFGQDVTSATAQLPFMRELSSAPPSDGVRYKPKSRKKTTKKLAKKKAKKGRDS